MAYSESMGSGKQLTKEKTMIMAGIESWRDCAVCGKDVISQGF